MALGFVKRIEAEDHPRARRHVHHLWGDFFSEGLCSIHDQLDRIQFIFALI